MDKEKKIKYTITIQEEKKEKLTLIFYVGGKFRIRDFWHKDLFFGSVKNSLNKLASEYWNKYYNNKNGKR